MLQETGTMGGRFATIELTVDDGVQDVRIGGFRSKLLVFMERRVELVFLSRLLVTM